MQRKGIKRRPMADAVLASLEPELKEYRELDGDGLYFRVKPDGGKSWQLRYKTATGKWSWIGLGGYPDISGALARKKATELRHSIRNGIDPIAQRRTSEANQEATQASLFKNVAEDWLPHKSGKAYLINPSSKYGPT
ncbi:uncharacterized protein DUF4102 [Azomonas agilis]|uniref:Uncharacterized protein DUF4102 n=1 Tax=Azomonas agilis TaxID=116849 RepID=A0A562I004_9GAMM|nr:Arm DNA-binding domain-containing protein [Azomonas agilis]TWH64008.1 uncharacterized protein DUF4102 [Azomonas agilis]